MFFTFDTSHFEISWLNFVLPINNPIISFIFDTSQVFIGPYKFIAFDLFSQYKSTALCNSSFVFGLNNDIIY